MPDDPIHNGFRPRILHVSADVPDVFNEGKTPVISRLIELAADQFDHEILSINRKRSSLLETAAVAAGRLEPVSRAGPKVIERGYAIEYLAPSKGLFHAVMLERLADWIAELCVQQGNIPDLVVGHKLTVEGIVVQRVADKLGIPYGITIQGNTDQKILNLRPDLGARFAKIFHDAACVFSFAPWARSAVELRLGQRQYPPINLPCPTVLDTIRSPRSSGNRLISVFHLRNHAIKNVEGLAKAMSMLAAQGSDTKLDIIGGGGAADIAICSKIIGTCPNITLAGARTQEELGPIMNEAIALVMPSRRESFGLVFVEALFAGLPIIYPKDAAVDGHFDGLPFAIAVDARSPAAIAKAIRHVISHEAEIKTALGKWQAGGGLQRFTRSAIAQTFAQELYAAAYREKPSRR